MAKSLVPFNRSSDVPSTTFGNMLDDFFSDAWLPMRMPEMETFKLDVKEDDKSYTIEAEMPGVKKEDISLNLDSGRLTIGVEARENKDEKEEKGKKTIHKERRYSYMERSIYLADATEAGAKAKLDNGELTITIPKNKGGKAKQNIEVK